jgi:NADH-quinone oxidoreductase subunit A
MLSDSETIALTLVIGVLAGALVMMLAYLLAKGPEGRFKKKRYEAGNPPKGEAKTQLPFQYYGFLLLYLSFEPIVALLFLYTLVPREVTAKAFSLLLVILTMFLPIISWGVKSAEEISRWEI